MAQLAKFLLGLAPLGFDSGAALAAGVLAIFVFFGVALLKVSHFLTVDSSFSGCTSNSRVM